MSPEQHLQEAATLRDLALRCGGGHYLPELLRRDADEHERLARTEPCPDCGGTGRVAIHVCRDEAECKRRCLSVQACMGCLGLGRRPREDQP